MKCSGRSATAPVRPSARDRSGRAIGRSALGDDPRQDGRCVKACAELIRPVALVAEENRVDVGLEQDGDVAFDGVDNAPHAG